MKKFRTIVAAVLVFALALAAIPAFAEGEKGFAPEAVNGNTFSNEFISFTVDSDARLSSYTTASGTRMLFGHSTGSGNYGNTSYTTISVNGSQTKYGSNLSVAPAFSGNTNYSAQTVNGVRVEQRLTPVENEVGNESIVEWRYTYTNTTNSVQNVGCRIMLDTCLGDDDGSPFRLPNNNSVTYESQISSNIPRYWFTYSGDMSVQGSFGYDDELLPDNLQFANWRYETGFIFTTAHGLWVTDWNYAVDTSKAIEDSAVAATWYEEALQPGETREYIMYYGFGDIIPPVVVGNLELQLNGEHTVVVNDAKDGYLPDPVTLMGILTNVGQGPATNSYMRIELPEGLTLIGDAYVNAGTIAVNGEYQHTWNYTIDETSYEDRTFVIRVYFGCDGQDEGYAEWTLFVPGIELVPPTINVARAELRTRETEDNKADLRFIFNVTFNDGFINHAGATYGPGAAYEITDFYSVVSVLGNTAVVPGNNIFEMHDDYYFFTAVVKGIRPNYFGTRVNATGYLEYVEVATGIEGADDTTDQIFSFCINDLL